MNEQRLLDPVEQELKAQGIVMEASWLFDLPNLGIRNGTKIIVRSTEIVYRVLDDKTVLVVLYRKELTMRQSLCFSFSALFWFLRFLVNHVPSIQVVTGLVDVYPYASDCGITSKRLSEFYQRCGAEEVQIDGLQWVRLELDRFVPLR